MGKSGTKHGLSSHKLYGVLVDMKRRCYDKKIKSYTYYGARGISVCEEWRSSDGIVNFYNWSMANGYQDGLSIDRENNDGNYEPNNCRWVTTEVQNGNKSDKRNISILGATKTLAEWVKDSGIPRATLEKRIDSGWDEEKILCPISPKATKQSGVKGIRWKKDKWSVYDGKESMGCYDSLEQAIRVKEGKEVPYMPRKNHRKSGIKGIYWKDRDSLWEVYRGKTYVGSRKELMEAIDLLKTHT